MQNRSQRLIFTILGVGLLALILWLINRFASAYVARVTLNLGITILLVVALNLSNGFTGVFSLGHVGFMAIGAYTAAILTLPLRLKGTNLPDLPAWLAGVQLPFLPATLIGGILALIVAIVVGIPMLRLSGHYVAVATMGFLIIVRQLLINWDTLTRGSRTFSGVPAATNLAWAYGWALLTIYMVWRIKHAPQGRQMLAVRENMIAARAVGINVLRARLLAFAISAFFTGVGGALYAHYLTSFSPASFGFVETFDIVTIVVIGGLGSISGSVIAAVLVTLLTEALRVLERGGALGGLTLPPLFGLSQIILAVIFILLIIFRPQGLFGDRELRIGALSTPFQRKEARRETSSIDGPA